MIETFDLMQHESLTGGARAQSAARLDEICRKTGFLVLTGHGVDGAVIAEQWAAVSAFFAQMPDEKAHVRAPYDGYPYGWLGPLKEALAKSKGVDTPPDLKESFNGGPLEIPEGIADPDAYAFCYQPTIWPDLPGFRAAWEAYYRAMDNLAGRIMKAMAEALGLDSGYFDTYIGQPVSALRALNYPATEAVAQTDQQRAGAHTDYGSLTILLPQANSRGLQIHTDAEGWQDVIAPQGAFVINIGDLMARWTADRWVSTLHRVLAVPNQPSRKSLAYFHQPDWEAVISPVDGSKAYAPVESGPYLMEKFRSTGN